MDEKYNLTGKRFNSWLVLSRAPNNKNQDTYWFCRCECGKEKKVKGSFLRREASRNCGCLRARKLKSKNQLLPGEGALRQLYNTYKNIARWKKRNFELSLDQFRNFTKGDCWYCGIPPAQILRRYHNKNKNPGTEYIYNGIDRLDNSKGYSIDNCVSCCGKHNKMKLTMSPEEFIKSCQSVIDYQKKRAQEILRLSLPKIKSNN